VFLTAEYKMLQNISDRSRNRRDREVVLLSIGQILFNGLCMAFIMSMCMAFVMAAINVGFTSNFLSAWLMGWGIGFVVSLPLSFFLPPMLQKIMIKLKL
jgi:small-conductance mechanosensitive channel